MEIKLLWAFTTNAPSETDVTAAAAATAVAPITLNFVAIFFTLVTIIENSYGQKMTQE
ncbi:MAG: hypothetical protein AAFN40_19110 [Cyanobacteria bacterium J06560_6]